MSLDERAFFTDRPESRIGKYSCPRCHRANDYSVQWVRRVKKDRPPNGADETDRARFAKLRDYLLRLDEDVVCKSCGKKFDIPSQHSLLFVDQLAGLPNDDELEAEIREAIVFHVEGLREDGIDVLAPQSQVEYIEVPA